MYRGFRTSTRTAWTTLRLGWSPAPERAEPGVLGDRRTSTFVAWVHSTCLLITGRHSPCFAERKLIDESGTHGWVRLVLSPHVNECTTRLFQESVFAFVTRGCNWTTTPLLSFLELDRGAMLKRSCCVHSRTPDCVALCQCTTICLRRSRAR